jgi:DNA modification methylase
MEHAKWFEGYKFFTGERGIYVHGDARELLKRIPSGVVDAVVTDPPWGVGLDERDDPRVFLDARDELHRVMKPNSWLVFFFTPKRLFDLTPLLERFTFVWMLVYIHTGYASLSRNPLGSPSTYSVILVFAKGKPKVALPRKDVMFADELPIVEGRIGEPQFKPTATVAALLSMFTREGDLVLDPFAGHGSVPLVCELFNRRWIAFEIDEVKYRVAEKIIQRKRVPNIKKLKEEIKRELAREKARTLDTFINRLVF